ncbi:MULTISPECIES: flagella biosynthesis regulatory protein FliT [Enterobacteriaceae]|jgi:Flagellar protein FliT.|uniref:Flagellar protein FliT n=1 Tax=Kluyvera genomosp. 2 TaxID=2774054 RepID=A0A2T2Y143_9ENTR|nr:MULTISPECIES: flagella biosynthesis regulatory protein FliT [Enterobacteriaceae]HAT3919153.1 flagella biosynthesis regulatory protein FliT [Kluyvera ascorbata]PSR46232.1 flagella biosynthesis regulatory protein FliT [Kluyvera genomosp. 2]BBQ83302.1 flagellar protein FliT [Klebsiella sp. WP3-W18-ESBL-02]BBR20397.1 flagellar protein FliT [Klebsiella sp. WP3-S18-ESBL-05]BBT70580.1 flagellar protein FliT [Klebsiella sp. WP8-S18-ESBL-06]
MSYASHLYLSYQQLVEKSNMMLRLATEGLWDELIASEIEYVNAVQKIAQLTRDSDPTDPLQEQLRPLLRKVLDNENTVKRLLQGRMDELAKLVGQSSMQKTVMTTYGNQGGHVLVPQDNVDLNH